MLRALGRATRVVYGSLALIPAGFSVASAVSAMDPSSPPERTRALAFFAWTGWLSLPLSVVLLAASPVVLLADPVDRLFLNRIQQTWARWTVHPFIDITVRGPIPKPDRPMVFVSNHYSLLDPYILMSLGLPMRFVAREEVFWIPLVGWVCYLIGHLKLVRGDTGSGRSVLDQCVTKLAARDAVWSVVFFAEGSRFRKQADGLGEFKIGAFKIAEQAQVPVIPVCITGTKEAMPPSKELSFLGLGARVQVEFLPALLPMGDVQKLRDQTREAIGSSLKGSLSS